MSFFYAIFIRLYVLAIRIASLWNAKAAEWINGRKDLFSRLASQINTQDKIIWVHCSSAGELEQGKPVIEALKKNYPQHKILLSFFSPSGYQVGKNYTMADVVSYLPADTRAHAQKFLSVAHPELIVFIKYEFWRQHLKTAAERKIPVLLVSAIFRQNQVFFKWYGGFYKNILHYFLHLFVQDEASANLLRQYGIQRVTVAGDTRFDRVQSIAGNFTPLEKIAAFAGNKQVLVAGSTWPDDEQMLAAALVKFPQLKLIIAPHEVNEAHLLSIEKIFPNAVRYSSFAGGDVQILLIDNFGMLSRLYHYATITYIGGGFNKSGIHNTLEAAVHGKPVLFGPNYQKFREAKALIAEGAAWSVSNNAELEQQLGNLLQHPQTLIDAGKKAGGYVAGQVGATQKLLDYIQANRLLTN